MKRKTTLNRIMCAVDALSFPFRLLNKLNKTKQSKKKYKEHTHENDGTGLCSVCFSLSSLPTTSLCAVCVCVMLSDRVSFARIKEYLFLGISFRVMLVCAESILSAHCAPTTMIMMMMMIVGCCYFIH